MSREKNGAAPLEDAMLRESVTGSAALEDPRLVAALEQYLAEAEAGLRPDREAFLARHVDIAGPLATCLDGLEALHDDRPDTPGGPGSDAPDGVAGPGTVLGDFRIGRELGRGGMGVVYEAEQVSLRRKVALKVLPLAATLDPRRLQRFQNEARAAACLHHTNIVPVFAVGDQQGVHYYAMQLIAGQTLAAVVHELRGQAQGHGASLAAPAPEEMVHSQLAGAARTTRHPPPATPPLAPPPSAAADESTAPQAALSTDAGVSSHQYLRGVARLGEQAAAALDYAHQLGIVHRDVKPGNLIVDARGQVWVTDFGLALFQQGEAGLTLTGDLVGTLRYMSPEQALAKRAVIDHRTDVYSLGATLYELLTLKPVFPGTDRQELLRLIAFEEPAPPRHLNKAVPAELETIVQKALEKNPAERYTTAQDLADDLRRFVEDKPIQARRPSLVQRAQKWARRHRALAGSVAAGLLLAALALAGSLGWVARDRAARAAVAEHQVAEALEVLRPGLRAGNPHAADVVRAARQAEVHLAGGLVGPDLHEQAEELLADLAWLARLEQVRLDQAAVKDGRFNQAGVDAAYAAAFREHGIHVDALSPDEAAARISRRAIAPHLVAALDDWAIARRVRVLQEHRGKEGDGGWRALVRVAQAADPKRDEWRTAFHEALARGDEAGRKTVNDLAAPALAAQLTPVMVTLLARALCHGESPDPEGVRLAVAALRAAQQRQPADFWLNLELGLALRLLPPPELDEALGHFRAALALRPESPGVHLNFGNALREIGRLDEAIAAYRQAVRLKKDYAEAHNNLGAALEVRGRHVEALAELREALRIRPDFPRAYFNLGHTLRAMGRLDEAIAAYREGLSRQDLPEVRRFLARALYDKGRHNEAITEYHQALKLNPGYQPAHNGLGLALRATGRTDDALIAFREAVRLNKDDPVAHTNLGSLLCDVKQDYEGAIAEFREALRLKKDFPAAHANLAKAHNNLGNALLTKGLIDRAIAELRGALQHRKDYPLAQRNLDRALAVKASRDQARAMENSGPDGVPQLAAILRGEAQPADASERTGLAGLCLRHGYSLAAARLCRDGFDDLIAPGRYVAVCAAALAGAGQGKDVADLDQAARARWRGQALTWLRPDLDLLQKNLEKNPKRWAAHVLKELQRWQADPRLASVREDAALAQLPAEEREAWRRLWADARSTIAAACRSENPKN
jgi:serine/threonine protein kinase/Tfp pilus assembly protein PilF